MSSFLIIKATHLGHYLFNRLGEIILVRLRGDNERFIVRELSIAIRYYVWVILEARNSNIYAEQIGIFYRVYLNDD